MEWLRLYGDMPNDPKWGTLNAASRLVSMIAYAQGELRRTCYPDWRQVERDSALSPSEFMQAFNELCECSIISNTFPSILPALANRWPLAPMSGPVENARPPAYVWREIRKRIFRRDNYTCRYCGAHGVKLECDHVVPVAQGGGHTDDNLATACFACNRSKAAKNAEEWRKL